MRKVLLITGGLIGAAILIVAALVGYAYFNLDSIIAANRSRLIARAGAAVGRPLEAGEIKASLGRGIAIEVTGVKLADDTAFSQLPFVQAGDVLIKVEFLPLLYKDIRVTELILKRPQIRIIRGASGEMNLATLVKKTRSGAGGMTESGAASGPGGFELPSGSAGGTATVGNVTIKKLTIEDGRILYFDNRAGGAPVTLDAVNLKVTNFSLTEPFDVMLSLAAFGDKRNLEINGTAGPIMRNGAIATGVIPVNLNAAAGPVTLVELRAIVPIAKAIPRPLAIAGEIRVKAKIAGTMDAVTFDLASDLSSNRVAYPPDFDKPAGTDFKFAASGIRTSAKIAIEQANLTLAGLRAKVSDIISADGVLSLRIDSNRFEVSPIASLFAPVQPYNPNGTAEIHAAARFANSKPTLNGTMTLVNVNATPPQGNSPPIGDLNGTVRLAGNVVNLDPFTFRLGSGHVQLQASADSIQPLHAIYRLNADKITLAELLPSRKDQGDENLLQVAATGTAGDTGGGFGGSTRLSAASGLLANVPFAELALDANFANGRVNVNQMKFRAFDGAIAAAGVATVGAAPTFDFKVETQNVNLQQALDSQHAKAANTVRGSLTASLQIAGRGNAMAQIKPTLHGTGRARMDNGKLIGVNVVGQALQKVNNVPGIGALVPAAVVDNHPELFRSPDTDIQEASLTFAIVGARITSQDMIVRSTDYSIFSDGWFDLDKNIDLAAKIKMSKSFSGELVSARRNVSYITNGDGEVEIPLRISGQLPHPIVAPDVTVIAQRAATHEAQRQVGNLIEKQGVGRLLKKNGLSGLLGGLTGNNSKGSIDSSGVGTGSAGETSTNPIDGNRANPDRPSGANGANAADNLRDTLKGLFH